MGTKPRSVYVVCRKPGDQPQRYMVGRGKDIRWGWYRDARVFSRRASAELAASAHRERARRENDKRRMLRFRRAAYVHGEYCEVVEVQLLPPNMNLEVK